MELKMIDLIFCRKKALGVKKINTLVKVSLLLIGIEFLCSTGYSQENEVEDLAAFDALICPFTMDNEYKELNDSISKLKSQMGGILNSEDCKNNTDVERMNQNILKIEEATKILKEYKNSNESKSFDYGKSKIIQNKLEEMVSSAISIPESLNSNSLLNSTCGKNLRKNGGILVGVGDLIRGLTPIAESLANINPVFAEVAAPLLVGASTAGSMIKVIQKMQDEGQLKIQDQNVRQILEENICEYVRVNERFQSIFDNKRKKADSWSRAVGLQPSVKFISNSSVISSENSEKDVNDMDNDINFLDSVELNVRTVQNSFSIVKSELLNSNQGCESIRKTIKQKGKILDIANLLVDNMTSIFQYTLNKGGDKELQIRYESLKNSDLELSKAILVESKSCQNSLEKYFNNLDKINQFSFELLNINQELIKKRIEETKNPDTKKLMQNRLTLRTQMSRILSLKKINRNKLQSAFKAISNPISATNTYNNITDVKMALISKPSGFFKKSPILAWFDYMKASLLDNRDDFVREVESLRSFLFSVSKYDFKDNFKIGARGEQIPLSYKELTLRMNSLVKSLRNFSDLNLENIEAGTDVHIDRCNRLALIKSKWNIVLTNYDAMDLFCSFVLDNIMDHGMDDEFLKACQTNKDNKGRIVSKSELLNLKESLLSETAKDRQAIDSAYKNLQCQIKN